MNMPKKSLIRENQGDIVEEPLTYIYIFIV